MDKKSIEGNPFIIRFKTSFEENLTNNLGIEGNPFIIRFKTIYFDAGTGRGVGVLKVIHL